MHHRRKGAVPQLIVLHPGLQPARQHTGHTPTPAAAVTEQQQQQQQCHLLSWAALTSAASLAPAVSRSVTCTFPCQQRSQVPVTAYKRPSCSAEGVHRATLLQQMVCGGCRPSEEHVDVLNEEGSACAAQPNSMQGADLQC